MNKKLIQELLNNLKEDNQKYTLNSRILIIDGLNCFLRSFAIINQLNSNHSHVGGLVGFLKSMGYAIKLIEPTRVIIVFDGPGGSANKKNLYPDYKGNRNTGRVINYNLYEDINKSDEEEAIANQMARLMQYLQNLPIDLLCIDGLEADDVMGYLVSKYEEYDETTQITLMSADQDFLQLVSSKTQVYSPTKKKVYKIPEVLNEYGVHPNNFIIMKTLLGDNSDNLPGINGLGPKKFSKFFANELVNENKVNLERILEISKLNQEKNQIYGKVLEQQKQLEINYQLMNLKEIPISNENIDVIENILLNNINTLNKQNFFLMYNNDNLQEAIPNCYSWLSRTFDNLQIYK